MDNNPASKRHGIGDGLRRLLDQRGEERAQSESPTAVLDLAGRRHVVRLVNVSESGAMVVFHGQVAEDDAVTLQLLDHGAVAGQVRWVRDGRVGINFSDPVE